MKSKYEIILYWSEADEAFVAEVPELPGCMADGSTYEEALTNALKHARASKVRVGFENPAGGLWRLFVEDDGMGLVNDGASAGSRGMANMRQLGDWAKAKGPDAVYGSAPGAGGRPGTSDRRTQG